MSKVLVEEPRSGRACARTVEGSRRRHRNRLDRDGESAPTRIGMKRDPYICKNFGEHLSPLYRYLRRQVNRPWSKVYGELCASLDRRSVVQAHLFEHIRSRVDEETFWQEDQVWVRGWRGLIPLSESYSEMYVHPRSGLLLLNRARLIADHKHKAARARMIAANEADRRVGLPHLPATVQWHRVDGIWFAVTLSALGDPTEDLPVYDVLLKRVLARANASLLLARYGSALLYASAKRQLDARTMRKHGLTNALQGVS